MIGSTISHYRVLDELGRGGMGVVYRAVDTRLGREVALKFLPEQVAGDATALTRFRREARAASALNHPNICTIYDVGEDAGTHYIAMELVRGVSLAQKLESGPLAAAEVCRIGAQLASALETAHAQGVIHRDVKPRNVFLTERGDAKLLDFGLAKATPAVESSATGLTLEADLTQEQRIVGTPSYMSPEQVLGRTLDGRSDLFSLGAVLYCMATGRRPFEGATTSGVLEAVLGRDPTPPTEINEDLPEDVARAIVRCLAKDPRQRYRDAGELRAELERLSFDASVRSLGNRATRANLEPSLDTRSPRRRIVALVFALAVIAAVALAVFLSMRSAGPGDRHLSTTPVIAVLPFSNQTGDPQNDFLGPALGAGLATELSEIGSLQLLSPAMLRATTRQDAMSEARKAGSELFVEGEVQRIPDRLRVQARLTDSRRGLILWSEAFEMAGDQVVATQSRIARAIAGFLAVPLSRRERARLDRDPTTSLTAWRLYAEGLRAVEEPTATEGIAHAIDVLTEATRVDPDFAPAQSALARALWSQYEVSKDSAVLPAAREAVERAEAIDPELPDTRVTRALVFGSVDGDLASTDQSAALSRHPRPATAHRELALLYERVGRLNEAERLLRRAIDLDPQDWFNWNWLGVFLFRHRDTAAAIEAFERAATLAPSGVTRPRENIATLHAQAGRFDQAIAILEELPGGIVDATVANTLGGAYYYSSRPDKWEKAERYYRRAVELEPHRALLQGNLADVYHARGRPDDAVAQYRIAMAMAEAELRADPQDGQAPLLVSLYGAKAGECAEALDQARRLDATGSSSSQGLHVLALVFSICRERDEAIETLRRAIESGFPAPFAAQEEEFGWLARDPAFRQVVGSVRGRAAAPGP